MVLGVSNGLARFLQALLLLFLMRDASVLAVWHGLKFSAFTRTALYLCRSISHNGSLLPSRQINWSVNLTRTSLPDEFTVLAGSLLVTSPRAGNVTGVAITAVGGTGNCTLSSACDLLEVTPASPVTCNYTCSLGTPGVTVAASVMDFPFASPSTVVQVTLGVVPAFLNPNCHLAAVPFSRQVETSLVQLIVSPASCLAKRTALTNGVH